MKSKADQLFEEYIIDYVDANDVKIGTVILFKHMPCKIIQQMSHKTGKHGCSRVSIVMLDLFKSTKLEYSCPGSTRLPIVKVDKVKYQVIDLGEDAYLQLSDEIGNIREFKCLSLRKLAEISKKWNDYQLDDEKIVLVQLLVSCGQEELI